MGGNVGNSSSFFSRISRGANLLFPPLYFCLHHMFIEIVPRGQYNDFLHARDSPPFILSVVINKARKWIINTIRDAIFVRHHLIIPRHPLNLRIYPFIFYIILLSLSIRFVLLEYSYFIRILTKNYPRWRRNLTTSKPNLWKIFFCVKASNSPCFSRTYAFVLIDDLFSTAPPFFLCNV